MSNKPANEKEIFNRALDLPTQDRADFLNRACSGNDSLRQRIDALLAGFEGSSGILDTMAGDVSLTQADDRNEVPGSVIDRYKLLQKIGEGGMGVVYMAEQTEPVTRKVALKIIKLGMDTKQVVARFEAERQALALMDHPNIAKVLDAGSTDTGRPYFVMELVRGVPITEYCDKNKLSNQERLELFIHVCQAIQHAHQKGVIHRDIKPSNVMVTLHDGTAVPKVIDFGIAKATNQKLTEKTLFTNYSHMIGTPAYMSPEQAEMSGLDVDTRTDVYSLGVLLYELLTGSTPFGTKELLSKGYGEMQRIIAEQEPPKPSRLISTMQHAERTSIAKNRGMEIGALNKVFQGDLDWIVMKALEKDRSRRYDTANGLAADIRRCQGNEPIVARPPSFTYRIHKTWRRNRVICLATALVFLALVAGGIFSMVGLRKAIAAKTKEVEQSKLAAQKAEEAEKARKDADAARVEIEARAQALKENLYAHSVALAYHEMSLGRPAHALQLIAECPKELREWEWNHIRNRTLTGSQPQTLLADPIFDFVISPNGRDVAIVNGEAIKLAELTPDGTLTRMEILGVVPPAFSEKVQWVAFSPDGQLLAGAGADGTVSIWGVNERLIRQTITCDNERIEQIAFHPSGKEIAVAHNELRGSTPITIDFHETQTGRRIRQIQTGCNLFCIAFSPDGQWLAAGAAEEYGHQVNIYNAQSGERIATLYNGSYPVLSVAFSPDGQWLASAGDPTIQLWNVSNWQLTKTMESHVMPITALVFNASGTRLISGSLDREIKIWDPFEPREFLSLPGHQNGVSELCLTTGGRLVSGDCSGGMRIWDVSTPAEHRQTLKLIGHQERIYTLVFHSTSGDLYSIGDDGGYVWDGDTGQIKDRFPGIFDLTLSKDGRYLVHTGTHQVNIASEKDASNSPPNQDFPVRSRLEDKTIESLDGGIGLEINDAYSVSHYESSPNPDQKMFFTSDISVDGEWLAGGTADGEIQVWKRKSGNSRQRLIGHQSYLVRVRFSPDGNYLVSLGLDGEILRWDATRFENPQEPFSLLAPTAIREIAHISFSGDGQRLLTGDGFGDVLVIEVDTGKELFRIPTRTQNAIVVSARFSPDGQWIASCGSDYVIQLWNAESGAYKETLIGHTSVVNDIAFSPDGKKLASAGLDQTILIWDLDLD